MRHTKVMLVVILSLVLTWLFLGTVVYLVSDSLTFKQGITYPGTIMLMMVFGWIPALVVGFDYDEKLEE